MADNHDEPCRELLHLRKDAEREREENHNDVKRLEHLFEQQNTMIIQNDKRISILEQQNKLIFWVYALITSGLVGTIFRMVQ